LKKRWFVNKEEKNMKKIIFLISLLVLVVIIGCTSDYDHDHDDDHLHDHSVEIEGSEMRQLTIKQVADLWVIDSQQLLDRIVKEFNLKGDYTTETVVDVMRLEYKFSPAIVKDIAEEIKTGIKKS
jgi:hypothetical protein